MKTAKYIKLANANSLQSAGNELQNINPVEGVSVLVTPKLASAWLANWNYEHQRNIRSYHVDSLARMMKDGIFRQKTQINFVLFEGIYHLTNGQHTLAAIAKSGATQVICVIVMEAEEKRDIADDFSRHDTHLTRQLADALVAHEIDIELGVSRTELKWIAAASLYYRFLLGVSNAKDTTRSTHDEKLLAIREFGELSKKALHFFEGHTNKPYFVRKTTLSSAMFCASKNLNAEQFWTECAKDDGLKTGDPRKTLHEWLRSRSTKGGGYGSTSGTKAIASDHELIKGIAAAWNAWVEGRELKFIRVDFDSAEAMFKGCGELRVKSVVKT